VRPQVEHTVARSQLHDNAFYETGLIDGKEQDMLPFPVTMTVLERGEERYNTFCTPCHSRVGNGAGMIVQRGYKPAGNFHDAKRLAEPLSHYFYVITNGYGAMPEYSAQLTPSDRWAVAAYIRALQLSQNAKASDLPSGANIEDLQKVATSEGLPASFAGAWPMPATAIQAKASTTIIAGAPASDAEPTSAARPMVAAPSGSAVLRPGHPDNGYTPSRYNPSDNYGSPVNQGPNR
jgi:cytochrome c5